MFSGEGEPEAHAPSLVFRYYIRTRGMSYNSHSKPFSIPQVCLSRVPNLGLRIALRATAFLYPPGVGPRTLLRADGTWSPTEWTSTRRVGERLEDWLRKNLVIGGMS